MKIHNTLTKSKVEFNPITKGEVKMYVCGVTPYDYAHIGNARPAIVFDTLYRFLKAQGNKVTYVRNFTDVDDKIINRAAEQGVDWQTLPQKFIKIYHEDMAQLNVLGSAEEGDKASSHIIEPLVTENIPEIIAMIKTLLENGHAYVAPSGDVLYDTTTFPQYGALSGNTLKDLIAGSRVEVSTDKRNPTDFVLWKSVKANEPMQWNFDYTDATGQKVNAGRPGWHIECSAMSKRYLGETFDIHGGGEDLKFPHHECEIAQSKGSCDGNHANYWMHNAFVNIEGEKMSKSLGNFKTIHGLLEKYSGEALRLWMLSTHYRKPVDLTEEALDKAEKKITSWYNTLSRLNKQGIYPLKVKSIIGYISDSLENDLNTPLLIGQLESQFTSLNSEGTSLKDKESVLNKVLLAGNVLGLLQQNPELFLRGDVEIDVDALVNQRNEAKANKDWALADKIRDELNEQGIVLEDGANGTTWRKA